ncbi:V-type proton ATPase subunit S1 [Elysia marginata]|uniref:V-type proton ATPase subunit S1 n=1 Tax=Elysia marginata TaxID=1093978 RepID=A0AAV4FU03_9GAST|nr:V-type proton ATPase subunit S1 [Elysia marginata]
MHTSIQLRFCSSLAFLLCCSLVLHKASAQGVTPALFWSPEKPMSDLPEVNGVDPLSADLLEQQYLNPLLKHSAESAVVFLQDKLHVDDFTKFADVYSIDSDGGAFKNIKGFIEEHFSLELPQVEDPLKAVEKLKSSFAGVVHTAGSLEAVKKLNLQPKQKFLLIIELTPSTHVHDEEQAIASNDALVGAICNHLHKRSIKYTAMFTGKSASAGQWRNVDTYSGRHLLAEPVSKNGTGVFMNVSGMYFFLRDVQVYIKQKGVDNPTILNLTVTSSSADKSTVDNKTAMVQFDLSGTPDNGTEAYNVQILFNTTRKGDRWVIENILLTVEGAANAAASNGSLVESPLRTGDMDLVVPILYSYHCSRMKMYVDTIRHKELKDYEGTYVILNGLQMQPFNVQHDAFFNAQDCVGFFSRAIWMGIFSSLILLAILFFGVMMVLNLSTPDRFDDPKGKTIVIAQAEDN